MNSAPRYTRLPLDAAVFGQAPCDVTLLQTHIGCVYLVGSYAFKLKKHVRFDFLDFTTLEQRRWACEREVQLNSRLCADLYLGVCEVLEDESGHLRVELLSCATGGSGTVGGLPTSAAARQISTQECVVDYAVKMKRLDLTRMLNHLLSLPDGVSLDDARAITQVLVPFYRAQRGKIAPGGLGDLECVRANVEENLREGDALDRGLLPCSSLRLIEKRSRHFLDKYGTLLQQRACEGYIVDGHGDLRSENICLPLPQGSRPYLFDCIEFNDRFRICDSALDIAFLAMDLDSRRRADLSAALLDVYRRECDPELPADLWTFYLGYRAFVKAKVAAWIASDSAVEQEQRQASALQAQGLFDLAVCYAIQQRPILLLFCGPSGSGKSTLASEIASKLRCRHFATDLIRDEMLSKTMPAQLRYSPENSLRIYAELETRARLELEVGRIVVVDGTFTSASVRQRFAQMARTKNATAILIRADCPPEMIARHLQARQAADQLFGSEATALISAQQRAAFEKPESTEGFDFICSVDTGKDLSHAKLSAWDQICECLTI